MANTVVMDFLRNLLEKPGPWSLKLPPAGLVEGGNLDLSKRPRVRNTDGSVSTVRSITVGLGNGRFALIPTVVGRRVVSNEQAIRHFQKTGQHLGLFSSEDAADRYAALLHEQQARAYAP